MIPLIATLTLPLIAALAAVALPARARVPAALLGTGLTLAATIWLALAVWYGGPVNLSAGGWAPPVGIALRADGLGAALAVMAALVVTATALATRAEHAMTDPGPRMTFGIWPLMLLLWAALNAVLMSRDLFNLYVGLELISLSAVALVAISGKAQAIAAGLRYLFFALAGSLLYLAGVGLTYTIHGTMDIGLLAARTPAPGDALALGLMSAGLLAKTAVFPFHVWLPPAHAAAPAPASALLSALVPKASLVILLRLWFEAMPDSAAPAALMALASFGALAVFWGAVMALVQARLKLIVAYSTVSQLGYVFLVFPLAGGAGADQPWSAGAWTGAVFQMLSHGLAKAAMFLTAGIYIAAVHSDHLRDLRGLARALPMTGFAFALAAVTLSGLPPSGGFTAKYLMMTSAFASGQWPWAVVLLGGGLLAAAYLYRPMAALFARETAHAPRAIPRRWQAIPLVLAALSVLLGLMSAAPFDLLQIGRPAPAVGGL
ncbi:complex I subunit 5 family protein [Roseicitreum antarcticum]|uniref:Formate hydrogenlyase subunit 3/Multisubunit Na+/H+ antiporter, MnhD subunit n=1 Tax=Roseicitreum antarcticum TaxID=564137 RepID=A0A1H3D5Y7_9RHOB|nr:proton-conducting transporter membrane subunit [Roseicitreum antarcticum]SDX61863.1 Formate hydrogenlyase subunit 3/Multisubunit Na+/H+ antiporter, MnhD subunit [Roseicitreum antarcticum]